MAITAATSGKNRIFVSVAPKSEFERAKDVLSSAVTYKQGDLLAFDTSSKILKVVSTTADSANFLGIADNFVTSGKLVGPYTGLTATDAAEAIGQVEGPKYGVIATLKLLSGDAFTPGAKVYLANGADSQTVTITDPSDGKNIGLYQGPALTAGATSEGPILLGCRYGKTDISF